MSSSFPLRAALVAALIVGLYPASAGTAAASNAEQVVFSGTGVPPVSSEPFGFWVWCQVEPASDASHYDTDCAGALYFYARGLTVHVSGEVYEPEEGVYEMELSAPAAGLWCELANATPIRRGPANMVMGECTLGDEAIAGLTSNNAVVVVTGPED